jgi:hypothetical protein
MTQPAASSSTTTPSMSSAFDVERPLPSPPGGPVQEALRETRRPEREQRVHEDHVADLLGGHQREEHERDENGERERSRGRETAAGDTRDHQHGEVERAPGRAAVREDAHGVVGDGLDVVGRARHAGRRLLEQERVPVDVPARVEHRRHEPRGRDQHRRSQRDVRSRGPDARAHRVPRRGKHQDEERQQEVDGPLGQQREAEQETGEPRIRPAALSERCAVQQERGGDGESGREHVRPALAPETRDHVRTQQQQRGRSPCGEGARPHASPGRRREHEQHETDRARNPHERRRDLAEHRGRCCDQPDHQGGLVRVDLAVTRRHEPLAGTDHLAGKDAEAGQVEREEAPCAQVVERHERDDGDEQSRRAASARRGAEGIAPAADQRGR